MGGAELRGSYENYYYDISYLLFVTDRRAAKYPFSSHSCMLWLYAISCIWQVQAYAAMGRLWPGQEGGHTARLASP